MKKVAVYSHKKSNYSLLETLSMEGFPYWKTEKSDGHVYEHRMHKHGGLKLYVCSCLGYINTGNCHHLDRLREYRHLAAKSSNSNKLIKLPSKP